MPESTSIVPAAPAAPAEGAAPAAPAEGAVPPAGGAAPPVEAAAPTEPAKKDPKAIAAEQERRLEARASALRESLSKREREIIATKASLDKREAAIKELTALKEAKEGAKDDPISFLEAFGLTFEDVAKAATEGRGADPAARKALKEARELRAKLEEKEKTETETQKKAQAEADAAKQRQTLESIGALIQSDKRFRYVAEFGTAKDVFDAWFQAYQKTGKLPDVKLVADKVNDYYKAQAEKAHKTWAEDLAAAEAAKKPAVAAPPKPEVDPKKPAVAVKPPDEQPPKKDDSLRGRARNERSYTSEIQKQLEEARKSRAT